MIAQTADLASLRRDVADACVVLAARGLADGYLGHVSVRVDENRLLVRCRGPRERGLRWTEPDDIRLVTVDGRPGAPGELDGWALPSELALHTEILRRHPDVAAVVHAHPVNVVAADLAGLAIRPILGAFDIPGCRLAVGGVPVYPRAVLVRTPELAAELLAVVRDRPAVILRGHGLTTTGSTVVEAMLRAISVDRIADISLRVASAGGTLRDLPASDLAELPDLGAGLHQQVAWRHELARLGDLVAARDSDDT